VTSWIDTFDHRTADQGSGTGPSDRDRAQHHRACPGRGPRLCDTRAALTLSEANYAAVQYIPRKDVDMTLLERQIARPTALTNGGLRLLQRSTRGRALGQTPCGPMKILIRQSCGSKTHLAFIPIVSDASIEQAGSQALFKLSAPLSPALAGAWVA